MGGYTRLSIALGIILFIAVLVSLIGSLIIEANSQSGTYLVTALIFIGSTIGTTCLLMIVACIFEDPD